MQNIIYLVLRRMRSPLIVLIVAYAITVLGLTLIPGKDDQGQLWHMDFFHAFYVVSFMGSTIGFGEIPYPFTEAQRMWITISIYISVTAWLYAIGSILTIVQDTKFRRVLAYSSFKRRVAHQRDPFYVVCGYGDTGQMLVHELAEHGVVCSVIDNDEDRVHLLDLQDLPVFIPGICADAGEADVLVAAGLKHPLCQGVIAVTPEDTVNLKVAITAKLLRPGMRVICRSELDDVAANMASFGTDHIINPFHAFADSFAMTFNNPSMHLVFNWVTAMHNQPLEDFVSPPIGTWVVCGYGRFGKSVWKSMRDEGIPIQVIEAAPHRTNPPQGTIQGRGTEASTLREAGIQEAVGIIAGTDDDANNLSILMTAKDLKPELFTVARQNQRNNSSIFEAYGPDLMMQPSTITAQRILSLITTPLLNEFLSMARDQDDDWANVLVSSVAGIVSDRSPETWTVRIDCEEAPAVIELTEEGVLCQITHILADPHNRDNMLPCIPLLLKRGGYLSLLPDNELYIQHGDEILFCGVHEAHTEQDFNIKNFNVLNYVVTGEDRPAGHLWNWASKLVH